MPTSSRTLLALTTLTLSVLLLIAARTTVVRTRSTVDPEIDSPPVWPARLAERESDWGARGITLFRILE